jgi:hypothetical protein
MVYNENRIYDHNYKGKNVGLIFLHILYVWLIHSMEINEKIFRAKMNKFFYSLRNIC